MSDRERPLTTPPSGTHRARPVPRARLHTGALEGLRFPRGLAVRGRSGFSRIRAGRRATIDLADIEAHGSGQ
jgi:hypothetical protein